MITLTKAQRRALKRIYDRGPLTPAEFMDPAVRHLARDYRLTYRGFRRGVYPGPDDGCVMVRWHGLWLGIERDGYVHS